MLIWGRSAEPADRHKAVRCYEETLRQCERSIALAGDEVEARFLKGLALTGLARMSTAELAIKHLGRALTALDEMLTRAPDDVDGRYEKGRALHELAKLEVAASKRSQAARIARNASREFARARELAPSDVRIARAEEELQKTLTESDSSSRVTSHR